MDRVVVTRQFMGLLSMQVCACKDVDDVEILEVANAKNPCGTTHGWGHVVRQVEGTSFPANTAPVQCKDYPDRVHYILYC